MIDQNANVDTWNIRKQVVGCIMFLKTKRRAKLKAKGCTEGRYHRILKTKWNQVQTLYNHILTRVAV